MLSGSVEYCGLRSGCTLSVTYVILKRGSCYTDFDSSDDDEFDPIFSSDYEARDDNMEAD